MKKSKVFSEQQIKCSVWYKTRFDFMHRQIGIIFNSFLKIYEERLKKFLIALGPDIEVYLVEKMYL